MKKLDPPLLMLRFVSVTVLVIAVFLFGVIAAERQTLPYRLIYLILGRVAVFVEEAPVLFGVRPVNFLQPARYPGAGVTVNEVAERDDYVVLASFFDSTNEIRLIRRNGEIVARWPVALSRLAPDRGYIVNPPATDWNVDLHGLAVNRDGSVVFNFEYTALIKLDRCGERVWWLPHQTHHSVERSEQGGYWVPGRRYVGSDMPTGFLPIQTPYTEDFLLKISETGVIEREISVPQLFYNSGLESILTANGMTAVATIADAPDHEIVHLNNIDELPAALAGDFPEFRAGDLLLSLREQNMILVVDPVTERIRWWQIGPWLRQHDPDFQPGGLITVFDNRTDDTDDGNLLGGSAIVAHDPVSRQTRMVWGGTAAQRMYTAIRGNHQMQPGGGVLVVETEGGRIFETDSSGRIVWEYINRYDDDEVAEINSALVLPADYFRDVDWSCNMARNREKGKR